MKNDLSQGPGTRFPSVGESMDQVGLGYRRRDFLKVVGAGAGAYAGHQVE